jgi:hypothetical protein
MDSRQYARMLITTGTPVEVQVPSPSSSYMVIFEDNGEAAYFYGIDANQPGKNIFQPLHIYDAKDAADFGVESEGEDPPALEIHWALDGQQSCLAVNGVVHAVFDFASG